jgi:hypothetical protein
MSTLERLQVEAKHHVIRAVDPSALTEEQKQFVLNSGMAQVEGLFSGDPEVVKESKEAVVSVLLGYSVDT